MMVPLRRLTTAFLLCFVVPRGVVAFTLPSGATHHRYQSRSDYTEICRHHDSMTAGQSRRLVVSSQQQTLQQHQSNTQLSAVLDIIGVSPEPIHTAFTVATFLPQPFWVLLILFPKSDITKKIMGGMDVVLLVALVHFFIVAASIVQPNGTGPLAEFNDVFDPLGDPQAAFMNMVTNYPNFVSEEWSHVLTWDFFVGRWIWLDGLKRGIFTSHSVLFSNLIGPPGLLMHWVTCLVTGKGFIGNEATEDD